MFYKVNEKEAIIIERFGRFQKVIDQSGLKFNLPGKFLKVAARIPLGVTQHEIQLETKTKDDIFATVPTIMHLQIVNPKTFHYDTNGNPYTQAGSKIFAAMKQLTNGMEFDELYKARETLGNDVRDKVGEEVERLYGLRIVDVIVDQPIAPASVQTAYNNAKASEQVAIGTQNAAQANKKSMILDAEARKEALRLDGEGVAEQRAAMFKNLTTQYNTLVTEGIPAAVAEKILLRMMELDTLRDVAKNGNVIVTTTADKDPITDMQAAVRATSVQQQPPAPKP